MEHISRKLVLQDGNKPSWCSRNEVLFTAADLQWGNTWAAVLRFGVAPDGYITKQEIMGRINRLLPLIRHGPHWKRRVQQFFSCCVCIRYRGNVSTEPLPSNDRGIFTEPLPSNDKGIFTEPLPSNDMGDTQKHTHRQQHDFISLLYF
jgi:hypothetical protein